MIALNAMNGEIKGTIRMRKKWMMAIRTFGMSPSVLSK